MGMGMGMNCHPRAALYNMAAWFQAKFSDALLDSHLWATCRMGDSQLGAKK